MKKKAQYGKTEEGNQRKNGKQQGGRIVKGTKAQKRKRKREQARGTKRGNPESKVENEMKNRDKEGLTTRNITGGIGKGSQSIREAKIVGEEDIKR